MNTIIYYGIGFNKNWIASKTEDQFLGHFNKPDAIWKGLSDEDRIKRLKELYKRCTNGRHVGGKTKVQKTKSRAKTGKKKNSPKNKG